MIDGWVLWLVLVGLAIGGIVAAVLLVRLPRDEADVGAAERRDEAAWISATIERHGGVAPVILVEEVLDLHQAYLRDPRLGREPSAPPPPLSAYPPPQLQPPPPPVQPPPPQQPPPQQPPQPPLPPAQPPPPPTSR